MGATTDLGRGELSTGEYGTGWMNGGIVDAMDHGDLQLASELAQIFAAARWGVVLPTVAPDHQLRPRRRDVLDRALDPVIQLYEQIAAWISPHGVKPGALTEADWEQISYRLGRIR